MKSIFRYIGITLALLFGLILVCLAILRLPAIQSYLADIATSNIKDSIGSEISIGAVNINFVDNVSLRDIYLEDTKQDTLVYAGELEIDFCLLDLLDNKLSIDKIHLETGVFNLFQYQDSSYNFDFIIDSLATENSDSISHDTTSSSGMEFFLEKISLSDILLNTDILSGKYNLAVGKLNLTLNKLDLDGQTYDIDNLLIGQTNTDIYIKETDDVDTSSISFPLSEIPITVNSKTIELEEFNLKLSTENTVKKDSEFDPNNFRFAVNELHVEKLYLDSFRIGLNITQLNAFVDDRIAIEKFATQFTLNNNQLTLAQTDLRSGSSYLETNLEIKYDDYLDLVNLAPNSRISLKPIQGNISLGEATYFQRDLKDQKEIKPYLNDYLALSGGFTGNLERLEVHKISAQLGNFKLALDGTLYDITDINKISFANTSLNLNSTISDLEKFIDLSSFSSSIHRFENINLSSSFSGGFKQMNFSSIELDSDGDLYANLSGTVNNLVNPDNLSYDLQIEKITTSAEDLHALVDSLPSTIDSLGTIYYLGKLKGTTTQYYSEGTLTTNQGVIKPNLNIEFTPDYGSARYDGELVLSNFDLGSVSGEDSLGHITATAQVNGAGLTLEELSTTGKLNIQSLNYNSYTYQNAKIVGSFDDQTFNGSFKIADNNINIDFSGIVDLGDSLPTYDFEAQIAKIDLKKLNFTEKDLVASLYIHADLKGNNASDIRGDAAIYNISLYNGVEYYKPDSFILEAYKKGGQNHLDFTSTIANVKLDGNFDLGDLHKVALGFADQYFPFSELIAAQQTGDYTRAVYPEISDENFTLTIRVSGLTKVTDFFDVPLEKLEYATLDMKLDAPNDLLNFDFFIPEIKYNSTLVDSLYISAQNNGNQLVLNGEIDSIRLNELAYIPQTDFSLQFKENSGKISLYLENDSGEYALGNEIKLYDDGSDLLVEFISPFFLDGEKWTLNESEPLRYEDRILSYPSISISKDNERLSIENEESRLLCDAQNFDIAHLINIVQLDSASVSGKMDLDMDYHLADETWSGDLDIQQIVMNSNEIGNLSANLEKTARAIEAEIALSGLENDVRSGITYHTQSETIDGLLKVKELHLPPFEPLLKDWLTETQGYLTGKMTVSGSIPKPVLKGSITLENVMARVEYLGAKYDLDNSVLSMNKNVVKPVLNLKDSANNTAKLAGKIDHSYFSDYQFDLSFNAKNFKFLNTTKAPNSLYYGILVADVDATITGGLDLPKIDADIHTTPTTELNIQLLSEQAVLAQENYIIFVDGKQDYTYKELDSIAFARYKTESTVDLSLNLETHEEALFNVVIDPITQDQLSIRGNAKLRIDIPPSENLVINGTFKATEGSYRFSYQDLLKRNFEIVPGGKIVFTGSPYDAQLDIKARYETKASVMPLVNQDVTTLAEEDREQYRKPANVDVILAVDGNLSSPELAFDIQVPNYAGGAVQNSVSSSLQRIKQNESDLNKQVFSLMLFNSFTGDRSRGNISTAGTATAVRSLGNLINRQLNELIGKSSGFEVNFEADNYNNSVTSGGSSTVTELDLGVSRSLLDDRVTISVGGNVDVESDQLQSQTLNNIAGDFVIAYKLTEDGKYRLRAFQRSDYDALNENNFWKTGVGLTYKTVFGQFESIN